MLHTTFLRWLKRSSRIGPRHRSARRPSFMPRLLALEDRTLPSTLTVLTNADSGPGWPLGVLSWGPSSCLASPLAISPASW
jgi:hypothetical protein